MKRYKSTKTNGLKLDEKGKWVKYEDVKNLLSLQNKAFNSDCVKCQSCGCPLDDNGKCFYCDYYRNT